MGSFRLVKLAIGAAATLVAIGGIALAVACVADLPPDEPAPQPSAACGDGVVDLDLGEQCDPGPGGAADAGIAGCSPNCTLQCASGLPWGGNNHCYQLAAANAASINEATQRCSDLGGHVATFASEDEFDVVAKWVQLVDAGPFWVGLHNGPVTYTSVVGEYEPGWSPACAGCFAHTDDAQAPLPRGIDAGFDGGPVTQNCVMARSSAAVVAPTWVQWPCAGTPRLRAVCEREPAGVLSKTCDAGVCIDLVATHGAKTYVYQPVAVTADEAAQACAALGGRLVVLGSRDEREQLWHELAQLPSKPTRVWVGLVASDAGDGTWTWDDGTSSDGADAHPPPWADRQPRDAGARTARAYLFHASLYDDTLAHDDVPSTAAYVCEMRR